MGFTMKNQKIDPETGKMMHAKLYNKCMKCDKESAIHCFPKFYGFKNVINERQQLYSLWRCIFDTEATISANSGMGTTTVGNQKKSLFSLLH